MAKKKRRRRNEEERSNTHSRRASSKRGRGSKGKKKKGGFKYKKRSAEDWKKRSEQSGYNRRSFVKEEVTLFRPKDGDNLIRILPPTWEDADHYGHELWVHYAIGADGDTFLDRNKMLGEPDPIEEERMQALNDNDKEYADKLSSKKRVAIYLVDRDEEDKGIQMWSMPWSMDADITTLAVDKRTGEVLDIDDPEDGYDVEFTKTGKGIKTQYGAVAIARKSSSLDNDEAMEDAIELPIPEALVYYEYEEIQKAFNAGGTAYDDDDEDEDEDDDEGERKSRSKNKGRNKKGSARKRSKEAEEEEEEEEEDVAVVTWEGVQEMDADELFDCIDENNLDVEDDIDEEDEDELDELKQDVCKELGLKKPKKRKAKKSEKDKVRRRRRR